WPAFKHRTGRGLSRRYQSHRNDNRGKAHCDRKNHDQSLSFFREGHGSFAQIEERRITIRVPVIRRERISRIRGLYLRPARSMTDRDERARGREHPGIVYVRPRSPTTSERWSRHGTEESFSLGPSRASSASQ